MRTFFKYIFYSYVILLATYVTYRTVMHRQWGVQTVKFEPAKKKCYMGGEGWQYCVHTTKRTRKDVYLYVFHGKDQDQNVWMDGSIYTGLLQNYWQEQKSHIPTVVTISFGPVWLITPKLSHKDTGLLDRFRLEVFSKIEGHLGSPSQRFLMGASMGGLNALSLSLQMPQFFSRVASLCPPLYSTTPYSSPPELFKMMFSGGAKPKSILTVLGIGRYLFKDDVEWRQFSPYHLIHTKNFSKFPSLYLSTGLRDEFGNFEGVQTFAQAAKKRGIQTYWRANSGDHCSVDAPSLGTFLSL